MNMTGYAVHLIAIAVHPSGAPDVLYMICFYSTLDAVQSSVAPNVHDSICSTPVWQIQYTK